MDLARASGPVGVPIDLGDEEPTGTNGKGPINKITKMKKARKPPDKVLKHGTGTMTFPSSGAPVEHDYTIETTLDAKFWQAVEADDAKVPKGRMTRKSSNQEREFPDSKTEKNYCEAAAHWGTLYNQVAVESLRAQSSSIAAATASASDQGAGWFKDKWSRGYYLWMTVSGERQVLTKDGDGMDNQKWSNFVTKHAPVFHKLLVRTFTYEKEREERERTRRIAAKRAGPIATPPQGSPAQPVAKRARPAAAAAGPLRRAAAPAAAPAAAAPPPAPPPAPLPAPQQPATLPEQ